MKYWLLIFTTILFSSVAHSQYSRYRVQLRDKAATIYQLNQPAAYLSPRAIERRTRYQIAIDSADLPVPEFYIQQIEAIPGVTLLNRSRWLNAVTVETTDPAAVASLQALSFVASVDGLAARAGTGRSRLEEESIMLPTTTSGRPSGTEENFYSYGEGALQEINLHNGQFLHNIGLRGDGMQIAVLDGGFRQYTSLRAFDSLNINGRVLGTWDFVAREASVVEDHQHGMMCLSTIVANIPGEFVGKAPNASVYLFRTEDVNSEFPIEEFNWVCGAERADSAGADLISSSLGYGYEWSSPVADYPYSDLNGDITMAARGADMAAARGLLVFNSAGNAGNDYWKMITTPADGDSVVAVAAVNFNGVLADFSSYGPSADGRIKPDMASVGLSARVQTTSNQIGIASGTSYACPNLAGLASCLWQGFPEFNNMTIVRALKQSGDRFNNPDNRVGYGIPDLKTAFSILLKEFSTGSIELADCSVQITWTSKDVSSMQYILEMKGPGQTEFSPVSSWAATGNSQLSTQSYTKIFPLTTPLNGTQLFRLVQVIDSSRDSYRSVILDTLAVSGNRMCPEISEETVVLYSNPPIDRYMLQLQLALLTERKKVSVQVVSSSGQLLHQQQLSLAPGRQVISLRTSYRSPGIYFVRLLSDGKAWKTLRFLQH